jgi:hypothetical protein
MDHLNLTLEKGTIVSKVLNTGTLSHKSRYAAMAFDLYQKISTMASKLTTKAIFSFDKEEMTPKDVKYLIEKSSNTLVVLPRRCYENYLIEPNAIFEIIAPYTGNKSVSSVIYWLQQNGGDIKYKAASDWNGDINSEKWLGKVDGAKLLSSLFSDLTDAKLEFQKTKHSKELTRILCAKDVPKLNGLLEHVKTLHRMITAP